MTLNRRTFIKGVLAATAAVAVPLSAKREELATLSWPIEYMDTDHVENTIGFDMAKGSDWIGISPCGYIRCSGHSGK